MQDGSAMQKAAVQVAAWMELAIETDVAHDTSTSCNFGVPMSPVIDSMLTEFEGAAEGILMGS